MYIHGGWRGPVAAGGDRDRCNICLYRDIGCLCKVPMCIFSFRVFVYKVCMYMLIYRCVNIIVTIYIAT